VAAGLFFHEDFREAETAAGKLFRIVVTDEGHAFLADFGEVDLPGEFGEQFGIELVPRCLVLALRLCLLRRWLGNFRGCRRSGLRFALRCGVLRSVALALFPAAFAFRVFLL
jgi:hypothetical protein